jgi:two-component system, OmpR family, response regulator ChvI
MKLDIDPYAVQKARKRKILVVDDEYDIALTYKVGLESNGFEVDVYNDPLLALSNFKAGVYDLLILDIRMPNMNGYELFKKMKSIDNKAKVCLITAFAIEFKKAFIPEVKCFIRKPITIPSLVKRVKAITGS